MTLHAATAFRYFNISVFLHFVGRGLYSTFVPILLLKNNYSLNAALAFLLFSGIITIVTSLLAVRLHSHRLAVRFNICAVAAEIILLLLLSYAEVSPIVFAGLLLTEGLYYGLYYLSYFSIVNHYSSAKKVSGELGNLAIASTLSSLITPLIGALLLDIDTLYVVGASTFFLLISLIPLSRITRVDINGARLPPMKIRTIACELIGYGALSAIEVVVFTLWSMYAYLNGLNLVMISSIPIASAVARLLISEVLKKRLVSALLRRRLMQGAVIVIIIGSTVRFAYPEFILATNILFGLVFLAFQLSIETEVFTAAKGYQTYQTSALLSTTAFVVRSVVLAITFLIGLRLSMLLPIAIGVLYLLFLSATPQKPNSQRS